MHVDHYLFYDARGSFYFMMHVDHPETPLCCLLFFRCQHTTDNTRRAGQNHIYTVYVRFFCRDSITYTFTYGVYIYTVLANPV